MIISITLAGAFAAAVQYQTHVPDSRRTFLAQSSFENRLRDLLGRAYMDEDQANLNTCFIAGTGDGSTTSDTTTPDTITFTTIGRPIPGTFQSSTETDFEKRNQSLGTAGGVAEVRLGLTPIGDPGTHTGLFIREQLPADEDHDQGGYESVLSEEVDSIGYEFFDGLDWITTWDSTQGERRLPAAVRVTYTFAGDSVQHVLVVRLRNSDVTFNNPIQTAGGAQ